MNAPEKERSFLYVSPMYPYSFAFHSSEPCHLSLCELMDGSGELCAHFVECEFADDVLGHELVLKSIIYQVFSGDRFVVRS